MTLLVLDDRDKTKRRHLFNLLGVAYVATPFFWLNIPSMLIVGIILAFILTPMDDLTGQMMVGVGFGVLIMITSHMHTIGHIISSQMVDAPVKRIVMTMTVNHLDFDEEGDLPSRVHVGRSLGGPVMNLVLGLLCFALYGLGMNSHFVLFFGAMNLVFFIATMSPLPTVDGPVIFRELRNWKSTGTT